MKTKELYRRLHLISLEYRRSMSDVIFVYKVSYNMIDCIVIGYQIGLVVTTHNTRHTRTFFLERTSTYYFLNSPLHRSLRTYNSLSGLTELDIFANRLDRFRTILLVYFRIEFFWFNFYGLILSHQFSYFILYQFCFDSC